MIDTLKSTLFEKHTIWPRSLFFVSRAQEKAGKTECLTTSDYRGYSLKLLDTEGWKLIDTLKSTLFGSAHCLFSAQINQKLEKTECLTTSDYRGYSLKFLDTEGWKLLDIFLRVGS